MLELKLKLNEPSSALISVDIIFNFVTLDHVVFVLNKLNISFSFFSKMQTEDKLIYRDFNFNNTEDLKILEIPSGSYTAIFKLNNRIIEE